MVSRSLCCLCFLPICLGSIWLDTNLAAEIGGNHNVPIPGYPEGVDSPKAGRRLDGKEYESSFAIFFLIDVIAIGTAGALIVSRFKSIQYTVLLFAFGVIYSVIHEGFPLLKRRHGVWGNSYDMWMDISPETLMWAFLPPLLISDVLTIDIALSAKVWKQVVWLAGPCVIGNVVLMVPVLRYVLGWDLSLCVIVGATWASTDPVAVVALLKDLGADPFLTAFIQGESLLNDGSSIIIFQIAFGILAKSADLSFSSILAEIVLKCFGSVAFGLALGMLVSYAIHFSAQHCHHLSGHVQITLTVGASYASWCIAEGVFAASGVLSVVGTGFALADEMWPAVVGKEGMRSFWTHIEHLYNTALFFLVGTLSGKAFWYNTSHNVQVFYMLPVIYICLVLVRMTVMLTSWPLLKHMSKDFFKVTWREIAVMTWSGLRGAVGFCLALLVYHGNRGSVNNRDAHAVLFYTGGIACLTMIVNAQLSPRLVGMLGITETTSAQFWMMDRVRHYLRIFGEEMLENVENYRSKKIVSRVLQAALDAIADAICIGKVSPAENGQKKPSPTVPLPDSHFCGELARGFRRAEQDWLEVKAMNPALVSVMAELCRVCRDYGESLERVENCTAISMACQVNTVFLQLVNAEYWNMLGKMELDTGRQQSKILLKSVAEGFGTAEVGLGDLKYIFRRLGIVEIRSDGLPGQSWPQTSVNKFQRLRNSTKQPQNCGRTSVLTSGLLTLGFAFHAAFMDAAIPGTLWMILHIMLTGLLMFEGAYNHNDAFRGYSEPFGNLCDTLLTATYTFGLFLEVVSVCVPDFSVPSLGSIHLLNRVLVVFRLRKLYYYWHAWQRIRRGKNGAYLEIQIHTISVLQAFVKAHHETQEKLLTFLGEVSEQSCVDEVGCCILESQAMVYRALTQIFLEAQAMDLNVVASMGESSLSLRYMRALGDTLDDAVQRGIIDLKRANILALPLEETRRYLERQSRTLQDGVVKKEKLMNALCLRRWESLLPGEGEVQHRRSSVLFPRKPMKRLSFVSEAEIYNKSSDYDCCTPSAFNNPFATPDEKNLCSQEKDAKAPAAIEMGMLESLRSEARRCRSSKRSFS